METIHQVDDATPDDRVPSTHEPCIGCRPVGNLDGVHLRGRVLVPQLTRQVRDLGIVTVTEQRLDVDPTLIGGRGYERYRLRRRPLD